MRKNFMILLALTLLAICSVGVNAECNHKWERDKTSDREYNSTYHYACYECSECYEDKYELEPHEFESIPRYYTYWDEDTCNAVYRCKTCYGEKKVATIHDWIPQTGEYEYSYVNKTYHKKSRYYECSHCHSTHQIGDNEKHSLKYYKSSGFIYYGCKKCNYIVGNKGIPAKWTIKTSTKKGKKGTTTIPLLAKDKIKSFKVTSGKALITVKKKSNSKLYLKTKKKGTAKLKVTTKSGAAYIYVITIK